MQFRTSIPLFSLLAAQSLAYALPRCSKDSPTPCQCPQGTDYSESVTVQVIGASAADVGGVINDFYDTAWLGAVPFKTQGPDNKPGSIRTSHFTTPIGVYDLSEVLLDYRVEKDGSFLQYFEQDPKTVPLEYKSGNGSFSGYWITIKGSAIFSDETLVRWSVYACETGHARNFAAFHEKALTNATTILQNAGKIRGVSTKPFSAQAF